MRTLMKMAVAFVAAVTPITATGQEVSVRDAGFYEITRDLVEAMEVSAHAIVGSDGQEGVAESYRDGCNMFIEQLLVTLRARCAQDADDIEDAFDYAYAAIAAAIQAIENGDYEAEAAYYGILDDVILLIQQSQEEWYDKYVRQLQLPDDMFTA